MENAPDTALEDCHSCIAGGKTYNLLDFTCVDKMCRRCVWVWVWVCTCVYSCRERCAFIHTQGHWGRLLISVHTHLCTHGNTLLILLLFWLLPAARFA